MNARALRALLGSLLAPAALLIAFSVQPLGWYVMSGDTLEGVPFDAALLFASVITGAVLGGTFGSRIVSTAHPLTWMALLAVAAGPVGAVVVTVLVLLAGGDPGRGLLTFGLLLGYSPLFALPLAIPVAVVGVLLLRFLASRPWWVTATAVTLTVFPVAVGVAASLSVSVAANQAPQPLGYLPPVSQERAVAAAAPVAQELSRDGAAFLSAAPYALGDIVAAQGCDDGMPPLVEGGCGSKAPAWAVFFTITAPDGIRDTIMVVIDGTSGELLLSGTPLVQAQAWDRAAPAGGRP